MRRYFLYLIVAILAFGIGVFLAFDFYGKAGGKPQILQTGNEIEPSEITTQNSNQINFDNLKIKGVGLSTSYSDVLRQIGKPLKSKKGGEFPCGNTLLTLRYSGLVLELEEDDRLKNFNVVSMEVTSPKWSVSGIGIGASIEEIQAKFGEPSNRGKESGKDELYYGNGDGWATFQFRDNKLVRMRWEYNWC